MRRSDKWFFGWIGVYVIVGAIEFFVYRFADPNYIELAWMLILSLPLWVKPVARWLNMRTLWE